MVGGEPSSYAGATMSDLQCPARLFLTRPRDEGALRRLAAALADERIAAVFSGDQPAAVRAGEELATLLAVSWTERAELRDLTAAVEEIPALDELADAHRGEAVVVVGGLTGDEIVALERDADGWSSREWRAHA